MNENSGAPVHPKWREGIFSSISIGAFFILIGVIFITTNGLWDKILNFFNNLTFAEFARTGIFLPAPEFPAAHSVLYGAVFNFCVGLIIIQILILMLRLLFDSPLRKTAETAGNLVFWIGASYLAFTYLNLETTLNSWFVFWTGIIIVVGLSWLFRALILLAGRR